MKESEIVIGQAKMIDPGLQKRFKEFSRREGAPKICEATARFLLAELARIRVIHRDPVNDKMVADYAINFKLQAQALFQSFLFLVGEKSG